MLGFDFGRTDRMAPIIEVGPVVLRPAELSDCEAWLDLRMRSQAHLTKWEPDWRDEDMTTDAFRHRLKAQDRERRAGNALPLLIFKVDGGDLVGGITLSNIRYFASCSASLGYWIGSDFVRQGFGLTAVEAVAYYAISTLGLNRVEAACQPQNFPSRRLLEKAGFEEEGLARDYLFINGAWRDHCLYSLTSRRYSSFSASF